MSSVANAEKLTEWIGRIERFERSNQTVSAFCQEEGVSDPSFYHWKRRLRTQAHPKKFKPVHVANLAEISTNSQAQTKTIIQLGKGIQIQLGGDLPVVEVVVQQLLAAAIDSSPGNTDRRGPSC